ncbi:hypothetical protein Emed_000224 [Eimeria media]
MQQHACQTVDPPSSGRGIAAEAQRINFPGPSLQSPLNTEAHPTSSSVPDVTNWMPEKNSGMLARCSSTPAAAFGLQESQGQCESALHPSCYLTSQSQTSIACSTSRATSEGTVFEPIANVDEASRHLLGDEDPRCLPQETVALPSQRSSNVSPDLAKTSTSSEEICVQQCQQNAVNQHATDGLAFAASTAQHPVRYDSALNMWVVVVPSRASRHLLFASKFCVKKRGYAEARRRALASYQRFLQLHRVEEKNQGLVTHPSMFFSRAKEAWCTQWYEGTKRIFKSFSCRVYGNLAEPLCRWFLAAVRRQGRRPSLEEVESEYARLRCCAASESSSLACCSAKPAQSPQPQIATTAPSPLGSSELGSKDDLHCDHLAAHQVSAPECMQWSLTTSGQPLHSPSASNAIAVPGQHSLNPTPESPASLHAMTGLHPAAAGEHTREAPAAPSPSTATGGALDDLSVPLLANCSEDNEGSSSLEAGEADVARTSVEPPEALQGVAPAAIADGPSSFLSSMPLLHPPGSQGVAASIEPASQPYTQSRCTSVPQQNLYRGPQSGPSNTCMRPPSGFPWGLVTLQTVNDSEEQLPQKRLPPPVLAEVLP